MHDPCHAGFGRVPKTVTAGSNEAFTGHADTNQFAMGEMSGAAPPMDFPMAATITGANNCKSPVM